MGKSEFLFLGTGGSAGIPMIGCGCKVCTSLDSRDKRLRPSGLLTCHQRSLLIDAGPDLRMQALQHRIDHLDGILVTHSHFDHVSGLDELRVYYLKNQKPLPVLVSQSTYGEIRRRYDYFFQKSSPERSLTAQFEFQMIEKERGQISFLGLEIGVISYQQAWMPVTGFRIDNFAYISDIKEYSDTIFEDLAGTEVLVLSMLREKESRMHLSLEEAIAFSQRIGVKSTFFTHMCHEVHHADLSKKLPSGFYLAYDGLRVEWEIPDERR